MHKLLFIHILHSFTCFEP